MFSEKDDLVKVGMSVYELLRENGGRAPDASAVRDKLLRMTQGLSAEDEFAALCVWSGKCSLVHKLDTDVRPQPKDGAYRVPDLLCIVDYQGRSVPVLIEVKTSRRDRVPLTRSYCAKLKNYADVLGLPLLFAFKHTKYERHFWSLFEFDQTRTPAGSFRINMPDILRHDLTGVLLGNFHVQIPAGTAMSVTITKERVYSADSFDGTLTDIHWETSGGQRVDSAPLFHFLFMLAEDEVDIDDREDRIVQRFRKTTDEGVMAYWAMGLAMSFQHDQQHGVVDWKKVSDTKALSFTMQDLHDAALQCPGLIRSMFYQVPQTMPTFLLGADAAEARK